jgi:hypothetical protein
MDIKQIIPIEGFIRYTVKKYKDLGYLSCCDMSNRSGIHRTVFINDIKNGLLPAIKVCHTHLVKMEDYLNYMKEQHNIPEGYLTKKDALFYSNFSSYQLHIGIKGGNIISIKRRHHLFIEKRSLDQWLDALKSNPFTHLL